MYFCGLMNNLIKSLESIAKKESIDSIDLNFIYLHIDGQTIGRLFFVENNTKPIRLCQFH